MYCINCRYYDKSTSTCLSRDGIKCFVNDLDFCSYCEPMKQIDYRCSNCVFFKNQLNETGLCLCEEGLYQCVFMTDYCSKFSLAEKKTEQNNSTPKVGWLYKNEDKGYIILEKINSRGLCEAYNYDENGEKLTYTLGRNSLGEPIMQVYKTEVK